MSNLFIERIDLLALIVVLLFVLVRWLMVLNKEASAPPIVINSTASNQDQKNNLITSSGGKTDEVKTITGKTVTNFVKTSKLGKSGYANSTLGQPCFTENSNFVKPNLPVGYTIQKCNTEQGEQCITGIYEGGGICLKTINEPCETNAECSPEADLCLNNLCQNEGEVINKPCTADSDCKGILKNFNHVCDTVSKRCVFDIWPKDDGCKNKNQCNFNKGNPGQVSCITPTGEENYIYKFSGVYSQTLKGFTLNGDFDQLNNFKGYFNIFDDKNFYIGRFLVNIILNPTPVVKVFSTYNFSDGQTYNLEIGSENSGGICVINYPAGTKPPLIPGTSIRYPCQEGLKLTKNNFCAEIGREESFGLENQVCVYDSLLSCGGSLSCSYTPSLVQNYSYGLDSVYISDGKIGNEFVKNIGRCEYQINDKYSYCNDNCKKLYVCLRESDINGKKFQYCSYDWDLLENQSNLTDCTPGFSLNSSTDTCKYNLHNFCFSDDSCANPYSCNFSGDTFKATYYDPLLSLLNTTNVPNINNNISKQNNLNLLVSNDVLVNDKPGFLGYYYQIDSQNFGLNYSLDGGNTYLSDDMTVTFEQTLGEPASFSVFKKSNGNYQLNVEYIIEYPNNRKRIFARNDNLYYSCLKNGTSVFFSNGFSGIYNINFSPGYVDTSTPGLVLLLRVDNSSGVSVFVGDDIQRMITYDSKFAVNAPGTCFIYESMHNNLNNGDIFTYNSNTESSLSYVVSGNSTQLSEGTCYYLYNFEIGGYFESLFFTEDYQSCNFNPYFGSSYVEEFNLEASASSGFTGDNSYLQLRSLFGFNFIPLEVSDLSYSGKTITVKERNDYIDNLRPLFNSPIGRFVDTTKITTDIKEDSLLITYNFENSISETIKIDYNLLDSLPITFVSDPAYLLNITEISTDSGTSIYYNNYTIQNSFESPNLKVPSGTSYGSSSMPYQIDNVRIFEESTDNNTINFLTSYKNIQPSTSRSSIANISNLRKMETILDPAETTDIFNFYYQGTTGSSSNFNPTNLNIPFAGSFYVELSNIVESLTSQNSTNNLFLGGTNVIVFKNQKDIDVLLKYGSSDLVIGYNNFGNAICITNIDKYEVDMNGSQTLSVKTSHLINYNETLDNPLLYVNNIYPVNYGNDGVTDGRILFSSSVPKKYLEDNNLTYAYEEASYNKILCGAIGAGSNHSLYDFYFFYNNTTTISSNIEFYTRSFGVSTTINSFTGGNYSLQIYQGSTSTPIPSISNFIYILNNKFLSSSLLYSPLVYLNNRTKNHNNSVVSLYTDIDNKSSIKIKGSVFMKLNTFPFYTFTRGDQGVLDESYLNQIMWPYWINNLNTGSINFKKLILNWNPGNMENDMFYYCLVEVNGVNMLLYLSTNFIETKIIESQPVPFILENENIDQISNSITMQPINKKLLIISPTCSNI